MDGDELACQNLPEEVLEEIFEKLKLDDLFRIQRVSRFWKYVSEKVLQRTRRVFVSNAESGEPSSFGYLRKGCSERAFIEWRRRYRTEEGVALAAYSKDCKDIPERLSNLLLPTKYRTLVVGRLESNGVIGSHPKDRSWLDSYNHQRVYNAVFLPEMPESNVSFLALNADAEPDENGEFFASFCGKIDDSSLKFVLVFSRQGFFRSALGRKLAEKLEGVADRGVVVTGGVCVFKTMLLNVQPEGHKVNQEYVEEQKCEQDFVAMFIRGKNVRAASVAIHTHNKEEMYLKGLKDAIDSQSGCVSHLKDCERIGYCSTCKTLTIIVVTSSYILYDPESWEDSGCTWDASFSYRFILGLLPKLFPNVPVFGGILHKEIGRNVNVGISRGRPSIFHGQRSDYDGCTAVSVAVLK